MATASTVNPPSTDQPSRPRYELSVNAFDRAATMIIALLIMLGASVAGLAVIFFSNKFTSRIEPIAVVPVEASSPTGNEGFAEEPEPPGMEEGLDLQEPALEDTLDTLSEVSLNDAIFTQETIDTAAREASQGEGLGDARQAGPGGDGVVERVPRWERWKIRFEPKSAAEFAAWLDYFKVRVGVLGRDNKVHVAWSFASGDIQTEAKEPIDYNAWGQTLPADGPMPKLTRDLARKAGILQHGRIALLFYPFEVETLLWTMEQQKNPFKDASGRPDANRVRETVFTVLSERGGFKFEIVDQKYF
ncbi:MAG: hypothetical protein DCC67_08005 [Planctomycetota bacterium]|nr:MAG: hypothetical protein DCC67_08005 [Planctomycetota bacterium]